MPRVQVLLSSLFAAIVVGLVAYLWLRWPGFVSVGIGSLFGVASLIMTGSLETHAAEADEAWRSAAPDLHARAAASADPEAPGRHPASSGPERVAPASVGDDGVTPVPAPLPGEPRGRAS